MEICYLIAFPDSNEGNEPASEQFKGLNKDAPYFQPVDYESIHNEFYLKDWKESVRAKLDNLENIVTTIQNNFVLSFENLMDRLQLLGWVLLLIGYLYLYFLDAGWLQFP